MRYPWSTLERGQSFFVVGIDTKQIIFNVMGEVITAGLRTKHVKIQFGVCKGKYGVLFTRMN